MERKEYKARATERRVQIFGGAAALASAADLTGGWGLLDGAQSAIVDLPWHGSATTLSVSAAAVGASLWTRQRRASQRYRRQEALHAPEWAGRQDRRGAIGLSNARKLAATSRPGLTWAQRIRADAAEVGIPVGKTISGPPQSRGRKIVLSWEEGGALVLGEPGSRKSTFLAGVTTGAPGATVVVSTKDEFLTGTHLARSARGPVRAFVPLGDGGLPDGVAALRWSLVVGCREARVAQRRANALMQATANAGLANSGFWESKGRAVLSALLCAADLQRAGLRQLAMWLQTGSYAEAVDTLLRHPEQVEASMTATLQSMTQDGDRTASSVSHTASAVLEFLQQARIADALDADHGSADDLTDFVRRGGTLYMVTDNSPTLGPVVSAIWDSIVDAAKTVAKEQRPPGSTQQPRLRQPLLLVADEVEKTLPSVPLDDHAAELRGTGIFVLAATQNRNRLVKVWGQHSAAAMMSSLQVHIILSLNDGDDRHYYERRIGQRRVEHLPTTGGRRRDNLKAADADVVRVPLWEADMWSYLERGHALVVPTRGAAAVVDTGHGWKKATAAGKAYQASTAHREWRETADREAAAREAARGSVSAEETA